MQLDKTNYTRRLGLPSHLVSNRPAKRYSPIGMTIHSLRLTPATENSNVAVPRRQRRNGHVDLRPNPGLTRPP